ncbi:MAG: LacI family DNA-binding transcriptional regulator [Blastopirellula sp. JB062]
MPAEFQRPKRVRLVDIAEKAGVSRRAVSAVLLGTGGDRVSVGEDKAVKIRELAKSMGYRPNNAARQLVGKRSNTYGLLVASAGDPLRSFLIQHLDAEAVKLGNRTLIANTVVAPDRFEKSYEEFSNSGVDGVLCAVHAWLPGDREKLLQMHPTTVFYENPGIANAAYATVDREAAIYQATTHLIERGRQRIGLALMKKDRPQQKARIRGYKRALADHGRKYSAQLFYSPPAKQPLAIATHQQDLFTWHFPEQVIDEMIEALVIRGSADAIIAFDDYWAAVLIKLLRRRGVRVPDDVAVIGYLNHYLADFLDPPLTTIDLSHQVAAREMVQMLEKMITTGELPAEERIATIEPRLIVREST